MHRNQCRSQSPGHAPHEMFWSAHHIGANQAERTIAIVVFKPLRQHVRRACKKNPFSVQQERNQGTPTSSQNGHCLKLILSHIPIETRPCFHTIRLVRRRQSARFQKHNCMCRPHSATPSDRGNQTCWRLRANPSHRGQDSFRTFDSQVRRRPQGSVSVYHGLRHFPDAP